MTARRFVVLRHETAGGVHHDLMLEREAGDDSEEHALMTWRCACQSLPGAGESAEPIEDHRRHYLAHEGELGGGRGTVERVDSGTWELLRREDERWVVSFNGKSLRGAFALPANHSGKIERIERN